MMNKIRSLSLGVGAMVVATSLLMGGSAIAQPLTATPNSALGVALAAPGSDGTNPPPDDPDAVAALMALRDQKLAAASQTESTSSADSAAAGSICIQSISLVANSQGTTVAVGRFEDAPLTYCSNAAQYVYDNEYAPRVNAQYQGQKFRDQLVCHIENAWPKIPWNLDSWRPDVGYAATVAAACNP